MRSIVYDFHFEYMQQIKETPGSTHILVLLTPNQTGAETNIICFWNARDQIYQSCYVMAEILEVDGYVKCSELSGFDAVPFKILLQ